MCQSKRHFTFYLPQLTGINVENSDNNISSNNNKETLIQHEKKQAVIACAVVLWLQ